MLVAFPRPHCFSGMGQGRPHPELELAQLWSCLESGLAFWKLEPPRRESGTHILQRLGLKVREGSGRMLGPA